MRVAMVITGLGMGGAEHVVVNLADALVDRGHQVMIAYLTGQALVLPQHPNVEVISIGMSGIKDIVSAYIKLRNLILDFKPDVVHSHMVHANIVTRLLRLSIKIPSLVCTAHNTNEGGLIRMLAYRLTDRLANISTNVSDEAVAAFIAKGAAKRGRMITIPNGIDTNKFKFDVLARSCIRSQLNTTDKHMLLAVGRLNLQKDYSNLFNAVALLKKERKNFKIFIVGHGPLKSELEALARALDIEGFIEFLGLRRDIPALMSAADTFVLSSAWEGFGLVVAEAMACEREVIATDCGGVKEIVGPAGRLIPPKDSVALFRALNDSLDRTAEHRATLGAMARKRIVDQYSFKATVDKYLDLYQRSF